MDKLSTVFTTPIGLELFGLDKIVNYLKDRQIFTKARGLVTGLFSGFKSKSIKIESKLDVKLHGWLERESYLVLEHAEVFIPRNMSVPYTQYQSVLLKIASELATSRKVLLSQAIATFGYYINSPASLRAHSIRPGEVIGSALPIKANKWLTDAATQMSTCLSPAQLTDTTSFTKAFQRNGEVAEVVQVAHELYSTVVLGQSTSIEDEAMQLMDLAEKLFDMIQNDPLYQTVSKPVMDDLVHRLQCAAEWTEFYATYAHQIQQMAVATTDTVAKLTKIAKS